MKWALWRIRRGPSVSLSNKPNKPVIPEEAFERNQDNERKEHRKAKLELLHFLSFDSSLWLDHQIKAAHRCFNVLFVLGFLTWWCPKSFHRSCSHQVPSRHVSASTTCKNSERTLIFKNLICSGLLAKLCWPCALSHDTWRVQSELHKNSYLISLCWLAKRGSQRILYYIIFWYNQFKWSGDESGLSTGRIGYPTPLTLVDNSCALAMAQVNLWSLDKTWRQLAIALDDRNEWLSQWYGCSSTQPGDMMPLPISHDSPDTFHDSKVPVEIRPMKHRNAMIRSFEPTTKNLSC